ncbi:MAG: hypothetical protein AAF609_07565 [Cyanobacteria bacterium P01_C01_bin.120]
MQILQEIRISRLGLAIAMTVLIADTMPHPSLSAGLLGNAWNYLGVGLVEEDTSAAAIAESQP